MRRHVPVPLTTVKGNCWAFHYQTPRYYGQTLQSTRSKTVVGGGRVEPDMQDKYEEATRSALQRACGPAGVIELARDGSLAPAGGGAEAMTLKHTQDKPAEKATPRAGIVPEMPAPALLSLARPLSPCTISRAGRCIETLELMQQLDKSPAARRPLAAR